jgi:hypothetical protein
LEEAGLIGLTCGDPWDISRQMALPLAYPDSHPYDIEFDSHFAKQVYERKIRYVGFGMVNNITMLTNFW